MAKYKKETSPETAAKADKVAKATQRPGQTKEQTKLIAQGIQKGIEQYKKSQKGKARELDKKLKQVKNVKQGQVTSDQVTVLQSKRSVSLKIILPWMLLIFSWIYFAIVNFSELSQPS